MSVPRILLAPTHRTGLANAVTAAVAEIATAQGRRVRYHHLGPLNPAAAWDRWEGAAFLDPALYDEETLLGLYDVATRGAQLSLLSSTLGLLDSREGAAWLPVDVAKVLDCPVVVVLDCRGWSTGLGALVGGLRARLKDINLAGALLSGVDDHEHCELLRRVLTQENVPVVGCLFNGDGPSWDATAPGAWGLPLDPTLLESVSRQVDVQGLEALAGQRGFLSAQTWLLDRGDEGPLVMVAGGPGFTPWSRDSIEILRSAGAHVSRLDLVSDPRLPQEAAGLVMAGNLWVDILPDIAMNQSLLRDIRQRIREGLPTLALGGGMLCLLSKIQDSLGRTLELADVVPADGEILWDLDQPAYVDVTAERDTLLLARGETVKAWVASDAEIVNSSAGWEPPLTLRGPGVGDGQLEGAASSSLLCSRVFVHLASRPGMGQRFVSKCADHAVRRSR